MNNVSSLRDVYIVDGARTPFLKAKGAPGSFSATELNEVIIGCVMPNPEEANIARIISLRLGCGKAIPAWTVQRNCGSGMQALDSAAKDIAMGRSDLVLAGGAEAMSRAPLLYNEA